MLKNNPDRNYQKLRLKVETLLNMNHKVGTKKGIKFDYTCPSLKNYPHQWLWDSCFHAITLTHLDISRAENEIRTLLLNQRKNGFIPCVSIWKKPKPFEEFFYVSRITQPPVIPIAVEIILERSTDLTFLNEVYHKLRALIKWLRLKRDKNNNNLLEIIHPWEDGDDGNPSFDNDLGFKSHKPSSVEYFYKFFRILIKYSFLHWDEIKIFKKEIFIFETVLFNSIYIRSLLAMSHFATVLKIKKDAKFFRDEYEKVKLSLINNCWNQSDQIFYDIDKNGKQSKVKNVSSLMALIIPDLPINIAKPLIEKHLLNPKEFWTDFPIASVSIDEASFNPNNSFNLWRGPMWINTNWFIFNALKHYGYIKEADYLAKRTLMVIEKYGFWEFYNPFTGKGYGQKGFGWSTLVLDMINNI